MPTATTSPAQIRAESSWGYEWPPELRAALTEAGPVSFNEGDLLQLAASTSRTEYFTVTYLTFEYFTLGLLWVHFARKAGLTRFVVVAMDAETARALVQRRIPHIAVTLPPCLTRMVEYRNRGGFNAKAAGLIYYRTQLIAFLLRNQINVLSVDIDALIIRNPTLLMVGSADLAFQRVVHFPKPLARRWGFTACAGFAGYRASWDMVALLDRVAAIQHDVSSDQLALNLALVEAGVTWDIAPVEAENDAELKVGFERRAAESFYGQLPESRIRVEALSAASYWRHAFVPLDHESAIVIHPNSPKSLDGKLQVFRDILGAAVLEEVVGRPVLIERSA